MTTRCQVGCCIIVVSWLSKMTSLRGLTDDYLAALELGQHKRVSDLSAAICAQLVELYEEGLDEDEEEEEERKNNDDTQYRIVDSLCEALRKQAQLAAAYNDVIQFVHVQDMICLSQMLDAIPVKETTTTTTPPTMGTWSCYEQLAGVLRKSIYLLRSINLADKDGDGDGGERELWLDAARLEWFRAISTFPTCAIDVGAGSLRAPDARRAPFEDKEALLEVCRSQGAHLAADWFLRFLRRGPLLRAGYPLDRFSLLVALMAVGAGAGHGALEQLMGELVAQVAHEEANCGDHEELLQLSQPGAFWLSHRRRRRQAAAVAAGGGSGSPAPSSPDSAASEASDETGRDWRRRLCRLIEAELVQGLACPLCGRRPDQPLAPIGPGGCSCVRAAHHCARTQRPLHLVPLADLLRSRPRLARLVVLWPGEWARQAWLAGRAPSGDSRPRQDRPRVAAERLQLGDKFERLTVVQPGDEQSDEDDEDDDDDDHHQDSSGSSRAQSAAGDRRPEVAADQAAQRQVAAFMGSRPRRHARAEGLSASAELLQWLPEPEELLSLNAADLLLTGRAGGRLRLHLATTKLGAELWGCWLGSRRSGLMLGCGRLYLGAGHHQCAHCGRPLLRLPTLAEALRAGQV